MPAASPSAHHPDIDLSAPVNLGGISIADGTLRESLALRADDLAVITDEDARLVGISADAPAVH